MPDEPKIICNHHRRPLVSWYQLPLHVREDFSYIESRSSEELGLKNEARFVEYLGSWYDIEDCDGLALHWMKAKGFDRYASDSFFSGVLFKYFDEDGTLMEDEVVVGRYYT